MQVKLSMIKSSAKPVRTTQDEAKIVELMESISEYGLLQAVEVRPAGDKYEVVFGNRRVEACRRLGHTHIEAVVVDLNDSTALIHGLIENVVREDLGPLDTARALKVLKDETGWSTRDMAAQGFMSRGRVSQLLPLLEEPEEIQQMIAQPSEGVKPLDTSKGITAKHVTLVRQSGLPETERVEVLKKASNEGLTASQARQVADSLKRTQDPKVRKRILELPTADATIWESVAKREVKEKQEEEKSRWGYLDERTES